MDAVAAVRPPHSASKAAESSTLPPADPDQRPAASGEVDSSGSVLARLSAVRVVLHSPRHPGNIGAAARAMKTMGLSRLDLVTPERYPDDEAWRRASGARDLLERAQVHTALGPAIDDCVAVVAAAARPREHAPLALPPRELMPQLIALAAQGPVALLFGGETNGLDRAAVNRCDFIARIPTSADYASLNLAAAVQVLCYEMRVAALAADGTLASPVLDSPLAQQDEIERLLAHAERTLIALQFLVPDRPSRLMERIARLARRARLEQEEINVLRGVLAAAEALCPGPGRQT
jgi:tRNA/rRNA methyltransferase